MVLMVSACAGRDAVGELQPAHDVDEHQVEADGAEHRDAGEVDEHAPMMGEGREQRRPLRRPIRRSGRCLPLNEAAAQHQAGGADEKADPEGNAPAPVVHRPRRHRPFEDGAGRRAQQDAGHRAEVGDGADDTAALRSRVLDQEDDGGRVFAADRQALHHAQQGEQQRRGQPEHVVARQHADQEGRHRHRRHREGERRRAADAVTDMAEQRAADRPHHEADGEHAERRQHLGDLVLLGKEGAADRGGEVAVDGEVVPFEQVADGAGGHQARRAPVHQDVSPNPQRWSG